MAGARDLPSGTVTFLFSDIEGSTRLLRKLGREGYGQVLAQHNSLLREALWATIQTVASDIDFDYRRYAAEHYRAYREARARPEMTL